MGRARIVEGKAGLMSREALEGEIDGCHGGSH